MKNFVHRTGYSIDPEAHRKGANLDNYEVREESDQIPRTIVTVETESTYMTLESDPKLFR